MAGIGPGGGNSALMGAVVLFSTTPSRNVPVQDPQSLREHVAALGGAPEGPTDRIRPLAAGAGIDCI